MSSTSSVSYDRLRPALIFQIIGPHTWAAACTGVLFAVSYTATMYTPGINLLHTILLLLICISMQSAANVLNDYFDFKKGTDSKEISSQDRFDAVMVYNNVNPRSVLLLASVLLIISAVLGIYLAFVSSWITLVIGLVGALAIVLYSAGRTPISYLPIGELVSGVVMGALIPLACVYVLTGILDWFVMLAALPIAVGIALILATNNTCDIEKDIPAQRATLSVVLGRSKAVSAYRATLTVWIALTILWTGLWYFNGFPLMIFMLIGIFPSARALLNNPLNQASRDGAMAQIAILNVLVCAFYSLSVLGSQLFIWL